MMRHINVTTFFTRGIRKKGVLAVPPLALALLLAFAASAFADDTGVAGAVGARLELRNRLDSIEVEKQARKRRGEPIDELETATAKLRDSLTNMRGDAYAPAPASMPKGREMGFLSGITGMLPDWASGILSDDLLSFRPNGVFDRIIVGTGFIALISGLTLVFSIFAGMRKRRAARKKGEDRPAGRKMDLSRTPAAPPRNIPAPATAYPFAAAGEEQAQNDLQSLMENLRKAARPQIANSATPSIDIILPRQEMPAASPAPAPVPAYTAPPRRAPAPPDDPPPPLMIDAPDEEPPPHAGPPPGMPALSDMVIAAANSGLNETEISKRYQISVDQIKLILRMKK